MLKWSPRDSPLGAPPGKSPNARATDWLHCVVGCLVCEHCRYPRGSRRAQLSLDGLVRFAFYLVFKEPATFPVAVPRRQGNLPIFSPLPRTVNPFFAALPTFFRRQPLVEAAPSLLSVLPDRRAGFENCRAWVARPDRLAVAIRSRQALWKTSSPAGKTEITIATDPCQQDLRKGPIFSSSPDSLPPPVTAARDTAARQEHTVSCPPL